MGTTDIDIFRAGTHTAMDGREHTFSEAALKATAAAYDQRLSEAPLVIGHPKIDAPAFGWVERLDVRNGTLVAAVGQVEAAFADAVREGRYKKVSVAFYPPGARNNPAPGVHYLRHVGFLGAQPPAVKGLGPVAFGDDGADVLAFAVAPAGSLDARERALETRERALARTEHGRFLDEMVRQGRFAPGLRGGVLAFMEGLSNEDAVAFSEGGEAVTTGALDFFKGYLARNPTIVEFGEVAGAGRAALPDGAPIGVKLPAGFQADKAATELLSRIARHMKDHNVSFADAARAVAE